MNKKIVFFDIDGTMVDFPAGMVEPLPTTIKALDLLKANGHHAVVCTARAQVIDSLEKVNFDGYIFCNGNYIEFQNKILYDNYFSNEHITFLTNLLNRHEAQYTFSGHFGLWASSLTHPLMLRQMELFGWHPSDNNGKVIKWKSEDIHANMATALFETEKQLFYCIEDLPKDWVVDAYTTGNIRMDIHLPGYTKGTAVKYLYEKLGIDFEDTFAFGDAKNDIQMFKMVKYGIAMGNGTEDIKAVAYDVTDDVDKDGIFNALKKYGLI